MKLTKDVVKGLVGSCLIKGFDGQMKIPPFHEEMWEMCCSPNRYVALAAPRG